MITLAISTFIFVLIGIVLFIVGLFCGILALLIVGASIFGVSLIGYIATFIYFTIKSKKSGEDTQVVDISEK